MKKKQIPLKLNKKIISNLNRSELKGGGTSLLYCPSVSGCFTPGGNKTKVGTCYPYSESKCC